MLKNIIQVLYSNIVVLAIGLINSFIFPKLMTLSAYAEYQTFNIYLSYLGIITIGLPVGMVIKYAGKSVKQIDQSIYKSEVSLLLIILTAFTFAALALSIMVKNKILFYIAIAILPYNIVQSYKSIYQAWGQFKKAAILHVGLSLPVTIIALSNYYVTGNLSAINLIMINLLAYIILFIIIIKEFIFCTKDFPTKKIVSKENIITIKVGFFILIGNYLDTLFRTVDKVCINLFRSKSEFAFYSFAMSMQGMMTVFITSLSQPLLPKLASGTMANENYIYLKHILFIFGSYSGCAYFACSYIVKNFISKYVPSLEIIAIYFAVFPALAVINCLYINLYKLRKDTLNYTLNLAGYFILAAFLDLLAVTVSKSVTLVALATALVYYFWLFLGSRHFNILRLSLIDYLFLGGFLILYFTITKVNNDILGFSLYFICITFLGIMCYGNSIKEIFNILHKNKGIKRS